MNNEEYKNIITSVLKLKFPGTVLSGSAAIPLYTVPGKTFQIITKKRLHLYAAVINKNHKLKCSNSVQRQGIFCLMSIL